MYVFSFLFIFSSEKLCMSWSLYVFFPLKRKKNLKRKSVSSPKNENYVINYSPSCRSKPVRPSFIFRTQIKIFLMTSESFLTLHRQQHNWMFKAQKRKIVMWYQWVQPVTLRSCENTFCLQRKQKITNIPIALLSMYGQKLSIHQKYLNLCSKDEQRSYRFGTTWGWAINDRI